MWDVQRGPARSRTPAVTQASTRTLRRAQARPPNALAAGGSQRANMNIALRNKAALVAFTTTTSHFPVGLCKVENNVQCCLEIKMTKFVFGGFCKMQNRMDRQTHGIRAAPL